MCTPVNPSFTILKWGVRGSSLHVLVFVMWCHFFCPMHIFTENITVFFFSIRDYVITEVDDLGRDTFGISNQISLSEALNQD